MEQALKIIIAKSPAAAPAAVRVLQLLPKHTQGIYKQYNRTVEMALNDPKAKFTGEDREKLTSLMTTEEDERTFTLRVRLLPAEKDDLYDAAAKSGEKVSEYVRKKLFG
jgi:hypothetical protein